MSPPRRSPPPLLRGLARVLLLGEVGGVVRADLGEAYVRDLQRGLSRGRANRRYGLNVVASALSLGRATLTGAATRGIGVDVRLGIRMLGRQPLLTVVAMLALGLGIPASLSFFHVTEAVFSPLPVPEGERLLGIRHFDRRESDAILSSIHDYVLWRGSLTSFEAVGAAAPFVANVYDENRGDPPVSAASVTASTFDIMRVPPRLGRALQASDEVPGAPDVALLGEELWRTRFGADPAIVGRSLDVNGRPHTVVGIMPASFGFPTGGDLWVPMRASDTQYAEGEGPDLLVYGRLLDFVDPEDADSEMRRFTLQRAAEQPEPFDRYVGEAVGMAELLLGEDRFSQANPELLLLHTVVLMMLFIVCGNVGLLVLARTATRAGELSIRTALGASRVRIVGQIFTESLVLAVLATTAGLLIAEWFGRWLMSLIERADFVPYWMDLSLSPTTVLAALGLAVLSATVAGVFPALRATRHGVHRNLQRTASGKATFRFGWGASILIVAEVVLSIGFLAMGGIILPLASSLSEDGLGFEADRYLSAGVRIPIPDRASEGALAGREPGRPDADEAAVVAAATEYVEATKASIVEALMADPEVVAVGVGRELPGGFPQSSLVVLEGAPDERPDRVFRAGKVHVDPSFFGSLGRPILAGRDFSAADAEDVRQGIRHPVIVNSGFVDTFFGGRRAVGERFRYWSGRVRDPADFVWHEIIGVVGRFGVNPLNPARDAGVYHVLPPGTANPIEVLVQVTGDPADFASPFRRAVASVDPAATVSAPMALGDRLRAEAGAFRFLALGQAILAGVAFLLSVTGLYALMSFTVSQRTREIGIRAALGARSSSIGWSVSRRAAIQLALGLVLGAAWAWLLLDNVVETTFTTPAQIPVTVGITTGIAGLVGVLGCLNPLVRGLRIQPTEALREL